MANNIELVTKHLNLLDTVYKQSAKSSLLEASSTLVKETEEANVVKIAKMDFDGLGDYDKNTGFPAGNVNLTWETHTFANDRGRKFTLDKMDNLESLGLTLLNLTGEFVRTEVVPEKDAYTFAKVANKAGTTVAGNLTKSTTKGAVEDAIGALGEAEVDEANLVIYMTPTVKGNLEAEIGRGLESGKTEYGQKINYFNEIPIITVPQTRFYSAIDLKDGVTGGQEAGGFAKADGAKDINFIVMDKNAVFSVTKNAVTKVITPEANQMADGWLFHFRFYYDVFAMENKKKGIYVHTKA